MVDNYSLTAGTTMYNLHYVRVIKPTLKMCSFFLSSFFYIRRKLNKIYRQIIVAIRTVK